MRSTIGRVAFVFLAAALGASLGCSGKDGNGGGGGGGDPKTANDLKEIGLAIHQYNGDFAKAPTKADDIKKYLEPKNADAVMARLNSGEIVVFWGVSIADMMKAGSTGDTVLAHHRDAPTKGGQVLMGDASVRKVTAEVFKTLKLAKKADK
jgi:hypothetical protein